MSEYMDVNETIEAVAYMVGSGKLGGSLERLMLSIDRHLRRHREDLVRNAKHDDVVLHECQECHRFIEAALRQPDGQHGQWLHKMVVGDEITIDETIIPNACPGPLVQHRWRLGGTIKTATAAWVLKSERIIDAAVTDDGRLIAFSGCEGIALAVGAVHVLKDVE